MKKDYSNNNDSYLHDYFDASQHEKWSKERISRSLKYRLMRIIGRLFLIRLLFTPNISKIKASIKSPIFGDVNLKQIAKDLLENGFAEKINLPHSYVKNIINTAEEQFVLINGDLSKCIRHKDLVGLISSANIDVNQAIYFNIYSKSIEIRNIASDPAILAIARAYIGKSARHLGTSLWWNYPTKPDEKKMSSSAQLYHYDLDDFRFIKFFFYITDVGPEDGPHSLVSKSHKNKPLKFTLNCRRYGDDEVSSHYGHDSIKIIEGKAGTGFVEDTFSIHKGGLPKANARLILQLYFARSQGFCDDRIDETKIRMFMPQ